MLELNGEEKIEGHEQGAADEMPLEEAVRLLGRGREKGEDEEGEEGKDFCLHVVFEAKIRQAGARVIDYCQ